MYFNILVSFLKYIIFFTTILNLSVSQQYVKGAHSHNDYLNKKPLIAALDNNFKSIEVDIFLSKSRLYVGHHWLQLRKNRTIENLYLEPLWKVFLENGGYIYDNNIPLYLLVDVKTSKKETYIALQKVLDKYDKMLSHVISDSLIMGAVTIIISGNKPDIIEISDLEKRNVFIDGRLLDIGKNISSNLVPLISSDWKNSFEWDGTGVFSKIELDLLKKIVGNVHAENKSIRFWGSPDNKEAWMIMSSVGVDLINTDKINSYIDFNENKYIK